MPSQSKFRFQKFAIDDDQCGMKIGTDAVLLGAWANVEDCKNILDIGTGCGIIAMMIAQRTAHSSALIQGIDIEENAARQAAENAKNTPWAKRLVIHQTSLKQFESDATQPDFDLCVCNPPFFSDSSPSTSDRERLARHVDQLSASTLFATTSNLLCPNGRLALVLPIDQLATISAVAKANDFHLIRQTSVRPLPNRPFKRALLEFSRIDSGKNMDELTIERQRHEFSPQYTALTKRFHLRFANQK